MQNFDVVIVGAGMVGAATAIALADVGLKVAIVEAFEPNSYSPEQNVDLRVSAISLASEQLLTQLGAWQSVLAMRACPYRRLGVWEQLASGVEFNAEQIQQEHLGHIVENRVIQLALWQQMQQSERITLFCPEQIQQICYLNVGVRVQLSAHLLEAKLIIGADGAKSHVRQSAGIGLTGWDYQQAAMLIYVETELAQQDITWQQFKPTGPVAMLPLSGKQASLVWYDSIDTIAKLAQLSNEQLTAKVLAHFPEQLGQIVVQDKAWFKLTRRHANQYVKPHVVLVGDAAHTINPLAGQGVNLGFKDVKVLQQVIADAIAKGENWFELPVLLRYQQQRRFDNQLMMTGMDSFYHTFRHPASAVKWLRNFAFKGVNQLPMVKQQVLRYACGLSEL